MEANIYDLVIIGSGPAGLSAAIYAERAKLNTIVIEKNFMSGGQVLNTYEVDNYPGLPGINGFDLGTKLREHAEGLGAEFKVDEVKSVSVNGDIKEVTGAEAVYQAKTVIIAAGAQHRMLGVPGEERLGGQGVSYCATCDGAFFKDKTTVVVGGGDVAVEDAIFLARLCKKVYVIHRRDELRAVKGLQEALFECENVEMVWDSVVESINGEDMVESVSIKNVKSDETKDIETNGVFVAVGIIPNSELFKGVVEMDEQGYIKAGEDGVTNVPGVYTAGDIRTKMLRQIITAAGDGASAVSSVQNYLNGNL